MGCAYCYIDGPRDEAQPVSEAEMRASLDQLEVEAAGAAARPLSVAIGCDTESLRSALLIDRTAIALETAMRLNLPVQLATKYVLPQRLRQLLDDWPASNFRPIVFTTITCVASAARIEPGAPPTRERVDNFRVEAGRWLSVALVKPFLNLDDAELDELGSLIGQTPPAAAVVGVTYRRSRSRPRDGEHPFAVGWSADRLGHRAEAFRLSLEAIGVRTFMNTECVVDFFNATGHGRPVFDNHQYLCVKCGRCQ